MQTTDISDLIIMEIFLSSIYILSSQIKPHKVDQLTFQYPFSSYEGEQEYISI